MGGGGCTYFTQLTTVDSISCLASTTFLQLYKVHPKILRESFCLRVLSTSTNTMVPHSFGFLMHANDDTSAWCACMCTHTSSTTHNSDNNCFRPRAVDDSAAAFQLRMTLLGTRCNVKSWKGHTFPHYSIERQRDQARKKPRPQPYLVTKALSEASSSSSIPSLLTRLRYQV